MAQEASQTQRLVETGADEVASPGNPQPLDVLLESLDCFGVEQSLGLGDCHLNAEELTPGRNALDCILGIALGGNNTKAGPCQ